MREALNKLSSRKLMIGFVAVLVLGLMAGLAFANNGSEYSGSELPDISRSAAPASVVNETLPNDSPDSGLQTDPVDTDSDADSDESDEESEEDSDDHSTVGSRSVYEREDTDD